MTTMRIWDKVCKTDPKHTKQVNMRGGFTSIDAMYQIQRATEEFGPVGEGWGYDATYELSTIGDESVIMAFVTVWHGNQTQGFGPVTGCNPMRLPNGKLDDDAPKKAMTDALTKALSHLGFSADVFLGRYDDNKYVASLKAEFTERPDILTTIVEGLNEAKTYETVCQIEENNLQILRDHWKTHKPHVEQIKTMIDTRKAALQPKEIQDVE